jgi:hypothetical protein
VAGRLNTSGTLKVSNNLFHLISSLHFIHVSFSKLFIAFQLHLVKEVNN